MGLLESIQQLNEYVSLLHVAVLGLIELIKQQQEKQKGGECTCMKQ